MTYSMTTDMSMGVEFLGIGFETSISTGYEKGIVNDTFSMLSQSVEVEYEVSCWGSEGTDNGVGLWQWVV